MNNETMGIPIPKRKQEVLRPRVKRTVEKVFQVNGKWPWENPEIPRKEQYRIYLGSPHWNLRRKTAIWGAGICCEKCFGRSSLTAHHITYKRIYNEPPEDLLCLCWSCHKRAEAICREVRRNGKELSRREIIEAITCHSRKEYQPLFKPLPSSLQTRVDMAEELGWFCPFHSK